MSVVLITGGSGCVGSAIQDLIQNNQDFKQYKFIFLSSKDCDLRDRESTIKLFDKLRPKYVIHLAAHVTGMYKNIKDKVSPFTDNIRMIENILEASNLFDINYGIFCSSISAFPDNPKKYPMDESMIFDGPPHYSIEGYAYAKRMMIMQCNNYNKQYGRSYTVIIPSNLYGPNDRFNLETAHVIPSLIHKFYLARKNGEDITIWGSGKPLKQFLYSYDLAKIILNLLLNERFTDPIICCNDEISVKDLAYKISNLMDFKGNIIFDDSKPDGCLRRTANNSYLKFLIPNFEFTSLEEGLKETIKWFEDNYPNVR